MKTATAIALVTFSIALQAGFLVQLAVL